MTIQSIIDLTPDYGTVNLDAVHEVITQTVTVTRPMTIRGGNVISEVVAGTPAVHVTGPRVHIHGMRITGTAYAGIQFSGDYGSVRDCQMEKIRAGIVADATAANVILTGNQITGGTDNGIYVSSGRHCVVNGNAVWSFAGHSAIKVRGWGNVISGNTVYDANTGITVSGLSGSEFPEFNWRPNETKKICGHSNIVTGNVIEKCQKYGIFMDTNEGHLWGTRITGNTITEAALGTDADYTGIRVYGPMTDCTHNLISRLGSNSRAAIDCFEGDHSRIKFNDLANCSLGLYVRRSVSPDLEPNEFHDVRTETDLAA